MTRSRAQGCGSEVDATLGGVERPVDAFGWEHREPEQAWTPSGRGESHPPALTDPDVTISRHPARIIQLSEQTYQLASGQIALVNVF